jgi:hypothetical protein
MISDISVRAPAPSLTADWDRLRPRSQAAEHPRAQAGQAECDHLLALVAHEGHAHLGGQVDERLTADIDRRPVDGAAGERPRPGAPRSLRSPTRICGHTSPDSTPSMKVGSCLITSDRTAAYTGYSRRWSATGGR